VLRIGLLGFGTIGREVAAAVREGRAGTTEVVAVLVRDPSKVAAELAPAHSVRLTSDPTDFLAAGVDLVVEAAGHQALYQLAEPVLRAGKQLMAISVGAFADQDFFTRISRVAAEQGCQVLIPSGAISGLDGISAAALADVQEVIHTTRKHPRAFTPQQLNGVQPTEPTVLFDGPAAEGVRRFPENVNVAAAVSLAGVGLARTHLRVIADPSVARNIQQVEVKGWVGELTIYQQNIPTENPKTGRIVALSIAKALQKRSAPVVIGA
jgi:aspartate dehydrogenase